MKKFIKNPFQILITCAIILLAARQQLIPLPFLRNPFFIMLVCFAVLAKSADIFVDSAVAMAKRFGLPKIIIGIFLVGLATTAPELAVSMMSALEDSPELALGNAVGSVICDDGLALAAVAVFSAHAIAVIPSVLKTAGLFLVLIDILACFFIFPDFTLDRLEGGILLALFLGYSYIIFRQHKNKKEEDFNLEPNVELTEGKDESASIPKLIFLFAAGLTGIIISSDLIIGSAIEIAEILKIPKTIVALTLIALGTSIPEVATCIIAAVKKEGEIAVGNIIGADILNICWVAGASAIANPLTIQKNEVYFMFPAMLIIVFSMLIMLRTGYVLKKRHGFILFGMYIVFLVSMMYLVRTGFLPPPKLQH